jgi:hypothetical protein
MPRSSESISRLYAYSGNQVPHARLAASGPILRGCSPLFMFLRHNDIGEQQHASQAIVTTGNAMTQSRAETGKGPEI